MRTALALLVMSGLFASLAAPPTLRGQEKIKKADLPPLLEPTEPKKDGKKEEIAPPVEFDQAKLDLETLKQGKLKNEGPALLAFFKSRSVDDEQKKKIEELIAQLSGDSFDEREAACDQLIRFGIAAVGLLRQAEQTIDPEVQLRLQRVLAEIEKVPTGALSQAAARQLGRLKAEGTAETLLGFLPFAEEEVLGEAIRATLAQVAMKGGTADPALMKALQDNNPIRRGAAAEAMVRGGDKNLRSQMRTFYNRETDPEAKLVVGLSLVEAAKEKMILPEVIKLMPEVPTNRTYRVEEILYALAGDAPPQIPGGSGDAASRKKASEAWLQWYGKNEAKIDLAKLDDREKLLGFTLIMEMDIRGIGGRIVEVGPDGKERWKIPNLQFPSDAQVLPGNRVLVAEHNSNQVTERDLTGKVLWTVQVNQPVNVQRLPSGNTFVAGRMNLAEFDRDGKQVFNFVRNEFDIVSGQKMRNGEYVFLTQRGQIIRVDKDGKPLNTYNVGRVPYWAGLEVMANGKILFTQQTGIAELDLTTGKWDKVSDYVNGTSCQKLPNGNVLVCGMNRMQVVELDRASKIIWEYKPTEGNLRPWRASRR